MKLKRLVSAVLAVGMALTILPTAAFAETVTPSAEKPITSLEIVNGVPKVDIDDIEIVNYEGTMYKHKYLGNQYNNDWIWKDNGSAYGELTINSGYSYAGAGDEALRSVLVLNGTVTGGTYNGYVTNAGVIENGLFRGAIGNYGKIYNGIFLNTVTNSSSQKILGGIFKEKPQNVDYYTLSAQSCVIDGLISDVAYIVGDAQTVTVTTPAKKFLSWKADGIVLTDDMMSDVQIDGTAYKKLTFKMPENSVTIDVEKEKTPLLIKGDVPVDEEGEYHGSPADGWVYSNTNNEKKLTIYNGYTADLAGNTIEWEVSNQGTLKNGTIRASVTNNGTIENVTFRSPVTNMGTIENCISVSYLTNKGTVKSGVFSQYTNFGEQDVKQTWLVAKNASIDGIEGLSMAGIVGKQTVTVESTDANFTGWVVSGDSDLTLTEEQRTSKKLTLELDGDKEQNIILTAATPENYQSFTVIDGKATNAEGETITSAKAGETVTLTANDAPDGMVFDRWEVTPTAAEEKLEGFDASAATTTFKMGTQEITIRAMYRMADVEEPNVLGTVAIVATAGVGAAVLGWTGYNIAADLYAQSILPEGAAIPETKEALAVMLWQNAGKPEVVAADGTALSETEQAQQWVVANGLMENEEDGSFHPEKGVSKFAALNTIKAQSEAKVNE